MTDPAPKAVVVPVEPTEAMLSAALPYCRSRAIGRAVDIYRAMVRAAPRASLPPVEGVREAVARMATIATAYENVDHEGWAAMMPPDVAESQKADAAAIRTILAAMSPVPSGGGAVMSEPKTAEVKVAREALESILLDVKQGAPGYACTKLEKLLAASPPAETGEGEAIQQRAHDLLVAGVEGFLAMSAGKKTDIHRVLCTALSAQPVSPSEGEAVAGYEDGRPAGWSYAYDDGMGARRFTVLNDPAPLPAKKAPTKHYGSPISDVREFFYTHPASDQSDTEKTNG